MLATLLFACASTQPVAEADSPAAAAPAGSGLLASWSGGEIRETDLDESTRFQLLKMEGEYLMNRYQTELQIAEGMAIEKMVEAEAAPTRLGGVHRAHALEGREVGRVP